MSCISDQNTRAVLRFAIVACVALALLGEGSPVWSQSTPGVLGLRQPHRITESLDFSQPRWSSPSSDTIAFVGSDGTYLGAVSARTVRKISDSRAGFRYLWSDDGTSLVYRGSAGDTSMAIYSIQLSTGNASVLVVAPFLSLPQKATSGAMLYHDGNRPRPLVDRAKRGVADTAVIAFQSEDNIFLVRDGLTTKVTHDDGKYFLPQLSPNGNMLLYQEISRGYFIYDLAKGTTNFLTRGEDATWSPDSRYIALERVEDDGYVITASELFVCDLLGNVVQLTDTPSLIEMEPAWSPNGEKLAYVADGAIYVADIIRSGEER